MKPVRCAALALALALPTIAGAQEELGLDLTGETTDLRPTVAVVGVDLTEGNPKRDTWVLGYIGTLITSNATKGGQFATVMKPEAVAQKLGDKYAEALKCVEDTCMVELASELGVERVITAQLSHAAATSSLRLNAFTRATLSVETKTVEVKGPPRGDFFKSALVALRPLFQSISGKLARIKVTPSVAEAQVTLGDRDLGTGVVDATVSAGTYLLKASADGYLPAQQQVELEEGGNAEVELKLVRGRAPTQVAGLNVGGGEKDPLASAAREPAPAKPGGPFQAGPYLSHPGTYVGAAGVVALLAGAGLGASAAMTQGRMKDTDGDGVLDITRRDALSAQSSALIANVLFAAGAVGIAGGGAWLFVAPPKGGGVGLTAGGKF